MSIPDYQTLMLPILVALSKSDSLSTKDLREKVGKEFKLTDEQQAELLPSGRQPIFTNRVAWGLVYLGIIVLANPLVLYSYCAKCICRKDACSHVFPGKLTSLLPARKQGSYAFMDYLGTALPLVALFGFPQCWLWKSKAVFIAYWILILLGLIEIFFLVCRDCRNENCPIKGPVLKPGEAPRRV